ncbi:hypothetical protein FOA52_006406 [Chlamydomonas sp. UWO 241]|nr:hypothetical protein FOA52_006406 [Chlamydomonas sp. UWO 241]
MASSDTTLALVLPHLLRAGKAQEVKLLAEQHGFVVAAQKRTTLSEAQTAAFCGGAGPRSKHLATGPLEALLLQRPGAVAAWLALLGPADPAAARSTAPASLRAAYGIDSVANGLHGSATPSDVDTEAETFFPGGDRVLTASHASARPTTTTVEGAGKVAPTPPGRVEWTLCLVKPHAVAAGAADEIALLAEGHGFTVIARQALRLNALVASEVLSNGREAPSDGAVAHACSGPVLALVMTRRHAVRAWVELAGPSDPEEARRTRPRSLRAVYGTDAVRNALHAPASPADAQRSIRALFPGLVHEPLLGEHVHAAGGGGGSVGGGGCGDGDGTVGGGGCGDGGGVENGVNAGAVSEYVAARIQQALAAALTALAREKPSASKYEALTFLADHLLTHNPSKPRIVMPAEWDTSMEGRGCGDEEDEFAGACLADSSGGGDD